MHGTNAVVAALLCGVLLGSPAARSADEEHAPAAAMPTMIPAVRNDRAIKAQMVALKSACTLSFGNGVRRQAATVVADVLRRLPPARDGYADRVALDDMFARGSYAEGLQRYDSLTEGPNRYVRYQPTSRNLRADAEFFEGLDAAGKRDYSLAERRLRSAAVRGPDGFPDALYFLGIVRAAEGRISEARHTWCFGLDAFTWGGSPPESTSDLTWNTLMARRLAGGLTV